MKVICVVIFYDANDLSIDSLLITTAKLIKPDKKRIHTDSVANNGNTMIKIIMCTEYLPRV